MSIQRLYERIANETCITDDGFTSPHHDVTRSAASTDDLLDQLSQFIYVTYHLGSEVAVRSFRDASPDVRQRTLLEVANPLIVHTATEVFRDLRYREDGWVFEGLIAGEGAAGGERVLASSGGLRLHFPSEWCSAAGAVGEHISVQLPRMQPYAMRGWAAVHSSGGPRALPTDRVRVYVAADGVQAIVECARTLINLIDQAQTAGAVKFGTTTGHADRPDNVVAFIPRQAWSPAFIDELVNMDLPTADKVPGFAAPVTTGVSFAHELPPHLSHVSVGQHRSKAVARGLLEAGPGATTGQKVAAIIDGLRADGVDPDHPHMPLLPVPDREGFR